VTRPRIVFATIAAGGGHVATARAMAQAVEALEPGAFDLSISDIMHDLGWTDFDERHKRQWRWMLAHPWTARAGQRVIDAAPGFTRRALRRALDGFALSAAEHFAAHPAALIVANHAFTSVALTRSRDRYGLRVPVLTFATEPLDASALWAEPDADRFVAPSRPTRDDLVRLGVPAAKIDVVGYPVQQAYLQPPTRGVARERLGLRERFTCLLSLGGEGIGGRAAAVVAALLEGPAAVQVVVAAGRNRELAAELRALGRDDLVVHDFVESLADHLAASDVVIGKAGPASVMEALAVGRPVLVTGVAGLNEVKVLRFLERRGLGHDARDLATLRRHVDRYAASPGDLESVATACRALDFAGMTRRLAHHIVATARHGLHGVGSEQAGLA
jgi:UDP-N-acetylglucosamine:LPS N-acetylglucosamine transferase